MGCACSGFRNKSQKLTKIAYTNLQIIPHKLLTLRITRSKNRRKGLYSVPEVDVSREISRRSSSCNLRELPNI